MFDPNNEFPDKITTAEKATAIIFMVLAFVFFIWIAYDTYQLTTALEAGEDVVISRQVGFLYDIAGKWPVIVLFLFAAVYVPYLLFNRFKVEWIKKQIEKTY